MSILFRMLLLVSLSLSACAPTVSTTPPAVARTSQPFVIAANPLAAAAGIEVLERGGSAVDAALAVQAMLSLVEPQSSGVGGGGFVNYYDSGPLSLTIYDGRDVSPASHADHVHGRWQPLGFREAC